MWDSIARLRAFSGLRILPFSRGDPGCHGSTSRFSISDVEPRMFGETTRPSNEQTRPYTARIREWEISLSRPSPVARRRLRHSLYVRIVCRTSPCNVYTEYRYFVRQLRPDISSRHSRFIVGFSVLRRELALSSVTQHLPVGLTLIHNTI